MSKTLVPTPERTATYDGVYSLYLRPGLVSWLWTTFRAGANSMNEVPTRSASVPYPV